MNLEPYKTIQIEKVPETDELHMQAVWVKFNTRLNDLANQGYQIIHATDTYILLRREFTSTRRED